MSLKILVIDDSEELCHLIHHHLAPDHDLIVVYDGASALKHIQDSVFDVILVDLSLPDMSGFEICSVIHTSEKQKNSFVVVMSARSDIKAKVTAYNLGALNYLEKPLNSEILKALMMSFNRHKSKIFESIQKVGNVQVDLVSQLVKVNDQEVRLTTSELKILSYFLEREDTVVSREALLKVIATDNKDVSARLVDTHISSLRKKIKESNLTIEAIYKEGYLLKAH